MFFIDLYMRKELSEIMRRLPAGWMRVVVDWGFLCFAEWDKLGLDCFWGKVSSCEVGELGLLSRGPWIWCMASKHHALLPADVDRSQESFSCKMPSIFEQHCYPCPRRLEPQSYFLAL